MAVNNRVEDMFRPIYELRAFIVWCVAGFMILALHDAGWYYIFALCALVAYMRFEQLKKIIAFRLNISAHQLKKIGADEMTVIGEKALKEKESLYLGTGFTWEKTDAQIAWNIATMDSDETEYIPKWLPKSIVKAISPKDMIPNEHSMGAAWIHGIGMSKEQDVFLRLNTLEGHVTITGTPGSGKTRLYAVLASQIIQTDSCMIIIDPKGDKDLENLARHLAKKYNREFLFFHPGFPSESVRLNPIKNWNVIADIGARLAQLISSDGSSDSFTKFSELSINRVCYGLELIGVRPSLKNIRRYVELGIDRLLEDCFKVIFQPAYGTDWDAKVQMHMGKGMKMSRLEAMAKMYEDEYVPQHGSNDVIDGLISTLNHSKEHYGKMILTLLPLLQTLCMGELGKLLSPDVEDLNDERPIYDMESVVLGKKILYLSLDALSNTTVSETLASTLVAELATVAGNIYKFHGKKNVYLVIDEVAEVANKQLVQILNKARGAGMKVIMAMQSVADLEVKLGSKPKAEQMLDNANNTLISLRVQNKTALWASEMMGETEIESVDESYSLRHDSDSNPLGYGGGVSRSKKKQRTALVHQDLLVRLPNLQYFMKSADGKITKGRLPLVTGL